MSNDPKQPNEGEGNRTAAREYNRDTRAFIDSGKVDAAAKEAKEALQGKDGEKLKKAEAEGKARAKAHDSGMPSKRQAH